MSQQLDRRLQAGRGVTLIELLIALSIITMLSAALAIMATAVQMGSQYSEGHSLATQHARVILERIALAVQQASSTNTFPGAAVLETTVGSSRFPNTLIVWMPAGAPQNPDGPPLLKELVIFCPDPAVPNRLLEITAPTDGRSLATDAAGMKTQIDGLKTSSASQKVVLSELMRIGTVGSGSSGIQAGLRFVLTLNPSTADWTAYQGGTVTWQNLPWPQGLRGANTAIRHACLRIELQLMPGEDALTSDPTGATAVPFLGSAVLHYEMHK